MESKDAALAALAPAAAAATSRTPWAGKRAVGIDLGTTNSCVAHWFAAAPGHVPGVQVLLDDRTDKTTMPSMVAFKEGDKEALPLVGWEAMGKPGRVYHAKRLIGRKLADLDATERACLPFEVVSAHEDNEDVIRIHVQHGPRVLSLLPEEISGLVLTQLKGAAERALGVGAGAAPVTHAVVTVPAYFDHTQRLKTKDACDLAGFEGVELLSEPTAAAMAYGLDIAGSKVGEEAGGGRGGEEGARGRGAEKTSVGDGKPPIHLLSLSAAHSLRTHTHTHTHTHHPHLSFSLRWCSSLTSVVAPLM